MAELIYLELFFSACHESIHVHRVRGMDVGEHVAGVACFCFFFSFLLFFILRPLDLFFCTYQPSLPSLFLPEILGIRAVEGGRGEGGGMRINNPRLECRSGRVAAQTQPVDRDCS